MSVRQVLLRAPIRLTVTGASEGSLGRRWISRPFISAFHGCHRHRAVLSIAPCAVIRPLQAVMKRWLPLSEAVLRMLVEHGPSPAVAQSIRVDVLWPQPGDASAIGEDAVAMGAEDEGQDRVQPESKAEELASVRWAFSVD